MLKCLSLFANVGVAEAYFAEIGIKVVLANELDEERANFYTHLYPQTEMVIGDITNKIIFEKLVVESRKSKIDFIIATPPCQGMSIAGKMEPLDPRNQLIHYALEAILNVKPMYVLLENVPMQLRTKILYNNVEILIPQYIRIKLEKYYNFNSCSLVKAMNYGVPQMRQRNVYLLTRKDMDVSWSFPNADEKIITLKDAIGKVPSLDPYLREGMKFTLEKFPEFQKKKDSGVKISRWHYPPTHSWKQVEWMIHTPSGKTAFDNEIYYPQKEAGQRIKGHYNQYRRLDWNKPSRTITQNNGVISSLACVHPGRIIKDSSVDSERIYSDPRVFSIYELLLISSLPCDWDIPEWADETLIRKAIGEGIPPLLIKKIMKELLKKIGK